MARRRFCKSIRAQEERNAHPGLTMIQPLPVSGKCVNKEGARRAEDCYTLYFEGSNCTFVCKEWSPQQTVHVCVGSGHRSNCTFVCREWSLQQLYTYVQGVVAVATIFSVAYCSNYNDRLPISSGVCAQNTVECTRACVGSGCYINGILITHCPTSNCNDRLGSHSKHIVTASWF